MTVEALKKTIQVMESILSDDESDELEQCSGTQVSSQEVSSYILCFLEFP